MKNIAIKTKILSAALSMLIGTTFSNIAFSAVPTESSEAKGLRISTLAKERDTGWGDMQSNTLMILRNKQGEESKREIRGKNLEQLNDGDKSLTIFDKPRDVKGTAFLSFSHISAADDQWLYLPALKRVKRISSKNKSGPFMGSEFSFEDLSSFEIEKFRYEFIKEEACGTLKCEVIIQYPNDKFSGYTRRIVWIDNTEFRIHKIEFYDRKNSLLKTLTFSDYKQYNDKFWRSSKQSIINHQNGKSTDLILSDIRFNTGLKDSDFNKNSLKRAR